MTRNLAALTILGAFLLGAGLPRVVAAQQPGQPLATACPGGGAQPVTSSFVEDATIFGAQPFFSPFSTGFSPFGVVAPGFFNSGFAVASVITTTQNFQGVQGLTQTVISDGFSTPYATIGVPDYLLQAYGGNITAIQRDLAAGFLKCRTR